MSFQYLNTLYTNRFFLLAWYNKLGIVHCTNLEASGCSFKKNCIILSEDLFCLYNQCRPLMKCRKMQHFIWAFNICKSTRLGFPRIQRVNKNCFKCPKFRSFTTFWFNCIYSYCIKNEFISTQLMPSSFVNELGLQYNLS